MNYINGIFNWLPGITTLFKSRGLATLYLCVHWFLAVLLVDFSLEVFALAGLGEPFFNDVFMLDIFVIGSISLAIVAIFYYYYLIGQTYRLITS